MAISAQMDNSGSEHHIIDIVSMVMKRCRRDYSSSLVNTDPFGSAFFGPLIHQQENLQKKLQEIEHQSFYFNILYNIMYMYIIPGSDLRIRCCKKKLGFGFSKGSDKENPDRFRPKHMCYLWR